MQRIEAIAREKGYTPAQLALAWLLARGNDIVPIPGTKQRARLEENVRALAIRVQPDELQRLDTVVPQGAAAGDRYTAAGMRAVDVPTSQHPYIPTGRVGGGINPRSISSGSTTGSRPRNSRYIAAGSSVPSAPLNAGFRCAALASFADSVFAGWPGFPGTITPGSSSVEHPASMDNASKEIVRHASIDLTSLNATHALNLALPYFRMLSVSKRLPILLFTNFSVEELP